MRLFVAIPLVGGVEAEVKRLTARLRPAVPGLRWTQAETWHITLQFLGNANEDQYACLLPGLSELKAAPFSVDFEGLGAFERAGVFFLAVRPSPALVALQKEVTAGTERCGFAQEKRPYHPHITLARTRSGDRNRELRAVLARAGDRVRFDGFVAREFHLYESHLSASGAEHEIKCRFPLED